MDEESNPTTTATSGAASTIIRATTEAAINSNKSISIGRSKCGSNNMETKGMNIPTDSLHAESKSSGNKGSISNEPTERSTTTTQEGIDINSSIICPSTRVSSNISTGHHHHHSDSNASTLIDPLKKSTTNTLALADSQQGEGNSKGKETVTREKPASSSTSLISTSSTTTVPITTKSRSLCATATDNVSSHKNDSGSGPHLACDSNNSEREADTKGAIVVSNNLSGKPPVPNFRVEGSGAGDSSITAAAVASLSSAVSAVTLHSSGGRGSNAGTNSLENNGEQPGSSGPVSIQSSSEEMRLSLVSWYSEPENPSGLIEGCCSALNTYRQDESGIVQDVGGHRESCDSNSIMGLDASSSATNDSPVCKSESEEKENKTPEPSGNIDKATIASQNKTDGMFVKSEFVNPNSCKKTDGGESCIDEPQNCESLVSKSDGIVVAKTNSSKGGVPTDPIKTNKGGKDTSSAHKTRAHVHVSEQRQSCTGSAHHHTSTGGGHVPRCQQQDGSNRNKPECPRCSRRSKSGTTTPASGAQTRTRTPASRRVVQSSKSSTEIKKPIKSILKHDSSRGSAGSSGSDKQSSMDSLGSSGDIGATPIHVLRGRLPNALMTRSDSGARARFHFSTNTSDTPTCAPEDKMVSKLKRIEKYATLRVRKSVKPRPLDLSDSEGQPSNDPKSSSSSGRVGGPGAGNEIMSKSMSYLEKSSNKVHISSAQGHAYGESTSASSTLRRQGSLRVRKSTSQWEPPGTRTSVLRLQKMQEAKAKNSNSPYAATSSTGSGNSGSAHSGSGDSLHYLPHSANSTSASGGSSGMSSIHLTGTHSAPVARMNASAAAKEKHMGAKIFSKLSSASGQTASSNQKRLRQERGIQTDILDSNTNGKSPVPVLVDTDSENVEQIKNLERLCNRYKNQFMKIQSEYEKSESKKVDLQKQLEEAQVESTEMIEFLQAEKSTLAESLTEVEVEAKKWKEEMEAVKRDYQSRCSSLVRLSEQHKQEALKSQALLNRLESQSSSAISQLTHQITDGAQNIHQTKQRVTALTESLLKIYKVPPELLAATETNQTIKETDLSCSLLLPLITSLSAAFPMVPLESLCAKPNAAVTMSSSNVSSPMVVPGKTMVPVSSETETHKKKDIEPLPTNISNTSTKVAECSSLFSLNQAILDREAAEKSGLLDDIIRPFGLVGGGSPDADQLSLRKEITDLNAAIAKLLNVVRVIVIHCDRKVSCVASSILQCLKSMEDDKVGNIAEIAQVQKSLEAWSDKGISTGSNSSSGSPPCKPSVTSASVTDSPTASYLVGNGHARV